LQVADDDEVRMFEANGDSSLFAYNYDDNDEDEGDEEEDEEGDARAKKEAAQKDLMSSLKDVFVFEFDDTRVCYPKFVGGRTKDSKDIAGVYAIKVET